MADQAKICFVIAPIGDPDTEIRKRSDQVLKHIITPAAKACGYDEVLRADKISEPGIITSQVIEHIINDSMVVADLTGPNPNVLYELAIRHAIRKPLVQLIQKGERVPFDVAATRVVYLDHRDLDSADAAREEITKHMRAAEKDPTQVDNPISIAIDLQGLKDSGNPVQEQLAVLSQGMSIVLRHVTDLQREFASSEKGKMGYPSGVWDMGTSRLISVPSAGLLTWAPPPSLGEALLAAAQATPTPTGPIPTAPELKESQRRKRIVSSETESKQLE